MARMTPGSFLLENGITCTGTAIQSKNTVEKGNGIAVDWALVKIWTGKWYQQAKNIYCFQPVLFAWLHAYSIFPWQVPLWKNLSEWFWINALKFSLHGHITLIAKNSWFSSFLNYSSDKTIKKITYKINTTACYWKERGKRRQNGTVSMKTFLDSSYNHGPYEYGVCTIAFEEALVINNTSPVDIFGRHSLAIESNKNISISSPLNLEWSPKRNRSHMWLGGFCSRDDSAGRTYGKISGFKYHQNLQILNSSIVFLTFMFSLSR